MYSDTPTPTAIELWMRSASPACAGPKQERALDRVETLESQAPHIDVEVDVWGNAIERVEQTGRTERARRIPRVDMIDQRLEAFETWAERTDQSLEPFFRTRRVESAITGEAYEVRRLPTVALAEYHDGSLVHVAPSKDGERCIEVLDRLERLLREESGADASTRLPGGKKQTTRLDTEVDLSTVYRDTEQFDAEQPDRQTRRPGEPTVR